MITKEIRNEHFEEASIAQQYLYASAEAGTKLFTIAERHAIVNRGAYKQFALTVGDIILGFYKIEDTVPLLQQELEIDEATAQKLGAEVLAFLAPLNDPTWQPPPETELESEVAPPVPRQGSGIAISHSDDTTTKRIPIKASALAVPKPIHTFASDMETVREYPEGVEMDVPIEAPQAPVPAIEPAVVANATPTPSNLVLQSTPVVPASIPTFITETPRETVTVPEAPKVPLEPLPSYTPPSIPIVPPPAPAPAPDRPRWSTDI